MRHEPHRTRLLESSNYLGLKFKQGWWFLQVLETEFIELKPWTLLNENGVRDAIAAQTAGSQDDEITDSRDRHYVVPRDDEQNLVFQVQYGIAPSRMQIYPFYGRDRAPNLRGTAEPGELQVPISGFDSPYNSPTQQSEFYTVNDMEFPSLQPYNPMDEPAEAKLSFHVNKLKYAVIEDIGTQRAFLQGQLPCRLFPMGLGAQERDQIRAPQWLTDAFGTSVRETETILNSQEQSDLASSVPGAGQLDSTTGGGA